MTPNEMPLPPCTARPEGLFSAISASSSKRIGGKRDAAGRGRAGLRRRGRRPDRRDPQLVAGRKPRVRPDLSAVHANLAAAQDPVDVALGNALQDLDEVIVDALPLAVLGHCKPIHSILA